MIQRPVICRAFVARRAELAYLHEQRLLASKSNGGIVLVAGDAGIGKSRLLREFCATLATSRWKIGVGTSLEYAQRPYGPVLDVLDAWDRAGASLLLPASSKRAQFDAVAERLAAIAAKTAVIGVVEDIHWADAGTLELLAFLAGRIERQRVLLLASYRTHELASDHPNLPALEKLLRAARSGRIDLAPLADADLRTFIDETLGERTLPPETRRLVAKTSEGNPFFTEELLKAAVERGATQPGVAKPAPLPSSIRGTLLERYRTLEPEHRAVLAQAAVIGPSFAIPLLAETLERSIDELWPTLVHARDHQLIEEVSPTVFRFRHALTRRAIYEDFLGAQAQVLHRTIATALEARPEADWALDELAYHWWAANDGERSVKFNTLAGDAAARVFAHEDAVALYERALESPSLDARARARIVEKIADRYQALGLLDRRYATYVKAAGLYRSVGDDDNEAQCAVRGAISAYTGGKHGGVDELEALLERLPPSSIVARARVHLGLAWLLASFSYPHEATRQLESVDRSALSVPDIALRYHNVAAWIAMTLGDVETFLREFPRWVEAARASDMVGALASARLNGGACLATLGLHDEGIAQCLESIDLARNERNFLGIEAAYANLAIAYMQSGDILRARAALAELPPVPESTVTIANAAAIGTLVGAHLGDEALIAFWFDRAASSLLKFPEADCGAGYAEILVRRGRMSEARTALRQSIPACEHIRGNMRTLVTVAKYGDPEDHARARTLLARAADTKSDVPEKPALSLFDAYVANRAGDHERGRRLARGAAEEFVRLRNPLMAAAAREAADETGEARAIFLQCGAVWDARRLLGNAPDFESAREDRAMEPDDDLAIALSPREREIASLVARGKSNAEIGRLLAISHKTVEKHLGSVYQKLGTSSRVQLATRLAARGGQ